MSSTIVMVNCSSGDEQAIQVNTEHNKKYALIMRLNMLYDRCVFVVRNFLYSLIRAPPFDFEFHKFKSKEEQVMKKLTVTVTNQRGEIELISAYVEDEIAEALKQCSDEVRRVYILDKHEEQNADRRESRRHSSLDHVMEEGEQFGTNEYNPAVEMMKREDNERLYEAMRALTDKQYQALWRYAVDGLTFEEIGVDKLKKQRLRS